MVIAVVGSNPSNRSPDKTAFSIHTRSGKTIREWLSDIPNVYFVNIVDEPTPNNRPLLAAEIRASLPLLRIKLAGADKVITVGGAASYAMKQLCRTVGWSKPWLHIPHPSGLCRKWNDPSRKQAWIMELRRFALTEPSSQLL